MSTTRLRTSPVGAAVTARCTACVNTTPFAKNSGAANRMTMTPGAVTDPAGARPSSESVGESFVASTSIAGFAARLVRLISASAKATRMPGIAPMNSVTRKQAAPIAGEGMSARSAVPKSRSRSVPTARTSEGSWVRDPA